MSLQEVLDKPGARIADVAAWLDERPHDIRLAATRSLDRRRQRTMYKLASLSAPITLEHFAPLARPDRTEVRHHGRNSLPVPEVFRNFEKRMCRPSDGTKRLFGYNAGESERWFGPGYFVAKPCGDKPVWSSRGDVVVDYFEVPDGPVADTWPAVVPNTKGLQRLVFHGTRDFMRKVSEHVSIGAAYKGERALDQYFVLCREDV